MRVVRNKEFSAAGKIWAGTKGAAKMGLIGAGIGSVLVPGNGLAWMAGKKKLAAGITAAGAIAGAGLGGYLGWQEGVNKYKYNNDPEYRKKRDAELLELIRKMVKTNKETDLGLSNEFTYASWKSLQKKIDVPDGFLKYVRFYETEWKKNIESWYNSYKDIKLEDQFNIVEFKEVFPIPIDPKMAEEWYNEDFELCLATANDAGDDGWLIYNTDAKTYGWDVSSSKDSESLGKILTDSLKRYLDEYQLSKTQVDLINKFKNKVRSL